jgi:hypothetical protein
MLHLRCGSPDFSARTPKRFTNLIILIPLLVVILFGCVAYAQSTTADIIGTATDASGAVLPGVQITIRNLATGAEYPVVTDGNTGQYIVTLLPIGRYSIRAVGEGFKTLTIPEVTLAIGDRLRQDLHLELGLLTQSVEVTASSPALQADSSSLGSLINERAVQNLPLNGRNFVVLAQLAVGASEGESAGLPSGTRPDDRRQTSAVSVNAQPTSFNNFLIDGMDDNERFIGTVIVKPSIDALVEMKVQTNLYSAELGRTAGGVMNFVTKSGSNDYHGSLFEFVRNEKMDARNFFAGATKPPYKQNQFGGSVGGAIIKNRTFFFGDYERFTMRQGQTFTSTVPTLAMRQGNFSGLNAVFDPLSTRANPSVPGGYLRDRFAGDQIPLSRMDPVSVQLMNLFPVPQTSGLVNNYTLSPAKPQDNDTFDVRIDHRLSDKDSLFVRYSLTTPTRSFPGPSLSSMASIQWVTRDARERRNSALRARN